jgi:hypothetical protein
LKNGFISPTSSKPAPNLVYEGLDKICKPTGFIDKNLPKTCSKPGLRFVKPALTASNQVYQLLINFINLDYQHANSRNSTKPGFSAGL